MKYLFPKTLCLIILLLSPFTIYAQSDTEIAQWVKQILLKTLSVDYNYKDSDDDELRKSFTRNGWNAVVQFLNGYLVVVKEQHLTLHPVFPQEPYVVDKGVVSGISYWRVDEVASIPELHVMIAFSLIVIQTKNKNDFLVQSMDMIKKEIP